jgi:hypothetical protein
MKTDRRLPYKTLARRNVRLARGRWGGQLSQMHVAGLRAYTQEFGFALESGDILLLSEGWYVTHAGLIRLARHKGCAGIHVRPVPEYSDPAASRWAFEATVYKSRTCKGFVGYGDADPSNVSSLVHGAEMRVAETRAVNRALRKAYGIGICSVEEIGSHPAPSSGSHGNDKRPPQRVNDHGSNGQPRLRDQLCQLIREHQLDPLLVKSYALDFCGTRNLNQATREQIQSFISVLSDQAKKDKPSLLCQLNTYTQPKQDGAA